MWRGGRWLSRESAGYSEKFTGYNNTNWINSQFSATMNELLINPDNQGCTPYWPSGVWSGATCQGDGGEWAGGTLDPYTDSNGSRPMVSSQPQRLESQPGYAYASVDLSGSYYFANTTSYPPDNNPAVNTVVREFVWVRNLETLVVFDRILTNTVGAVPAANMRRTFLAHCESNWNLLTANSATCVAGTQQLNLVTLLPATPNPAYHVTNELYSPAPATDHQYRLEVDDTPGTAQSYFLHVLQGMPTTGTKLTPSVTDNGSSYTVTLDSSHSITFQKGATSSGGSITLSGTTTNFATTVEPITVTSSGPLWGAQ